MGKRRGAQTTIPTDWESGQKCYCIYWPDSPEWKAVLMGLLSMPTRGRYWDGRTGSVIAAQNVGWLIWEANVPLTECGDGLFSLDENGLVWLDTDGDGIPDEIFYPDPASTAEKFPAGYGLPSPACLIAEGTVNVVETFVDETSEAISVGMAVMAFMAVLAGIVSIFVGNVIAGGALIEFAVTLLALNQQQLDDNFTQLFYDELKCTIMHSLNNDNVVTEDEFGVVLQAIADNFEGLQETVAWNVVSLLGAVGMTNAPTTYALDAADCTDCNECPPVETADSTTWWYDGVEQTGYIPVDGREVTVVGGLFYGARFTVQEHYYQVGNCPRGFEGFCVEFVDVSTSDGESATVKITFPLGGDEQVDVLSLEGESIAMRKIEKMTQGVTDEQIITARIRILPCVDYECPE